MSPLHLPTRTRWIVRKRDIWIEGINVTYIIWNIYIKGKGFYDRVYSSTFR